MILASLVDVAIFVGIAAVGYFVVAFVIERVRRVSAATAPPPAAEDATATRAPGPPPAAPESSAPPAGAPGPGWDVEALHTCPNPECRQILVGRSVYCARCGTRVR